MAHFLITIFTVLCLPLVSFAEMSVVQSENAPTFYDYAKSIPLTLIKDRNIKKIGKLDLENIVSQIDRIPVVEKEWVETNVGAGNTRIFARWEITELGPTITLNKRVWNKVFQEKNDILALHEVFGSLGYDDENYNLSISLRILANDTKTKLLSRHSIKEIKNNIEQMSASRNGGVIGVGGGGDLSAIFIKIYVLDQAYLKLQENPSIQTDDEFMTRYWLLNSLKIEAHWKEKDGTK